MTISKSTPEENTLSFVIYGNQTDKERGNAIPKLKATKGQQWTEVAKRYVAWKHYIQGMLIDQVRGTMWQSLVIRNIGINGKPLSSREDKPVRMDILISWANKVHGDPENIFGSIADALFKQDKYLSGSFDYQYAEQAKVEIKITFKNL